MAMNDWRISNSSPNDWVYYVCAAFANVHFSRSVDDNAKSHMAMDGGNQYYFGFTGTFSPAAQAASQEVRELLVRAWEDYFTVK
ncbi:hypothetical protein AB0I82_10205 [Streptomyces sp. NPDC050315]|uniref:hypothetical protein n=1 Tax=Streptomyces sp. NPDC050315 TaxID=3155039 RepID=UPI00343E13E7